jgi:hypothetical protein
MRCPSRAPCAGPWTWIRWKCSERPQGRTPLTIFSFCTR